LTIDPNDKYALNNKGWVLTHQGNYAQAIPPFEKALAIDPFNVNIYLSNFQI
jgi:Tfp pilus assembly protein PilF